MINLDSVDAVSASRLNAQFGKPLYDSYCFSQIPQTIYHLLTGDGDQGLPASVLGEFPHRYDKVILLYLDAFGWRFLEQYQAQYPFLTRLLEQGVASKLTTQFPSTTAAHTTTIHTGLTVGQSGVFEWFYYEPTLDRIIAPLNFSFMGDFERNTLLKAGVTAADLFQWETFHERLKARGISSYAFQSREYTPSPFSDATLRGANISAFKTIPEGLTNLVEAVLTEKGPAYFYLYIDTIDTMSHRYGPGSRQFDAEVDITMIMLERLLHQRLAGAASDTLLLVTADHGHTEVSPKTTLYLNQFPQTIAPFIKTNQRGDLLVPAGSARDMFLYIQDDHVSEAVNLLREQLSGRAEVFLTEDLIAQGMFGSSPPSATFLSRVGNVVVLPYAHETVWWYEKGKTEQRSLGMHGGLSAQEMETILLAMPY